MAAPTGSNRPSGHFIRFHIWDNENVGHAGYEYGTSKGESRYFGLQPRNALFANTFFFLSTIPIRGRHVDSLQQEQHHEGTARGGPKEADRQFTFPITEEQYEQVEAYTERSREKIESGEELYTFFPNLPIASYLKRAFLSGRGIKAMGGCPPIIEAPRDAPSPLPTLSHCTTKTRDVAKIIGLPIAPNNPLIPYVINPKKFGDVIEVIAEETEGAETVKKSRTPTDKEKLDRIPI